MFGHKFQHDILSDDDEWPAILISHHLRYVVLAKFKLVWGSYVHLVKDRYLVYQISICSFHIIPKAVLTHGHNRLVNVQNSSRLHCYFTILQLVPAHLFIFPQIHVPTKHNAHRLASFMPPGLPSATHFHPSLSHRHPKVAHTSRSVAQGLQHFLRTSNRMPRMITYSKRSRALLISTKVH